MKGDLQDNMMESPDETDPVHGFPVFSLYGEVRRPTAASLETFDVILIDLQDLGCRIYTFITTLLYVLEAAAEHKFHCFLPVQEILVDSLPQRDLVVVRQEVIVKTGIVKVAAVVVVLPNKVLPRRPDHLALLRQEMVALVYFLQSLMELIDTTEAAVAVVLEPQQRLALEDWAVEEQEVQPVKAKVQLASQELVVAVVETLNPTGIVVVLAL
jgi:hypothetical protein